MVRENQQETRSVNARYLIAAVIFVFVAWSFLPLGKNSAGETDYAHHPVLLVHGHGLSSADWESLKSFLINSGYPTEYLSALDIRPSRMSNKRAAEQFVAPAVESLLQRASELSAAHGGDGFSRVDIVAHSMGAISTRWYAARIAPERVRRWISVAGSNHGTNSLCNHSDDGAFEMCPAFANDPLKNELQTVLNGTAVSPVDETPYGVGTDANDVLTVPADDSRQITYYTIRIDPDEWITPAESAMLDGAGGGRYRLQAASMSAEETAPGNFLLTGDHDHMSMLREQALHALVGELLGPTS